MGNRYYLPEEWKAKLSTHSSQINYNFMNNTSFKPKRKINDGFARPQGASAPNNNRNRNRNQSQGKKKASTLDPRRLVKKAVPVEETVFVPTHTYEEMPLHSKLKNTLKQKGYTHPTAIQEKAIQHIIDGKDLLGIANTGTGKTGAFLIPIIHRLLENNAQFQSLVVVPTRELALQIEDEFKSMTKGLQLFSSCFIGGTNLGKDLAQLKRKNHIVIGTPGRLIDLMSRRALRLESFSVLVLDEFDRMLDMGFVNDVKQIIRAMVNRKQTLLFSATLDNTQKSIIDELLHQPVEVKVSTGATTSDHIEQDIIHVPEGEDKFKKLLDLISQDEFEKVLIFAETKRLVDRISHKLTSAGVKASLIHGNKSQNTRQRALDQFKRGNIQVLVATDVAARGIDVSDVTHVINYQIPQNFESYVHRIGRTGRAGKGGKAFTFVN